MSFVVYSNTVTTVSLTQLLDLPENLMSGDAQIIGDVLIESGGLIVTVTTVLLNSKTVV